MVEKPEDKTRHACVSLGIFLGPERERAGDPKENPRCSFQPCL